MAQKSLIPDTVSGLHNVSWKDLTFWKSSTWLHLQEFLENNPSYLPGKGKIFRALTSTPLHKTKIVIIGTEPYTQPGFADGFAFSSSSTKTPEDLNNIFIELSNDMHIYKPSSNRLDSWAKQGVLLLNSVLTVQPTATLSHAGRGWEALTDEIVALVADTNPWSCFVLWGVEAQRYYPIVKDNYIIKSTHPGPLTCGVNDHPRNLNKFFGSKPFSKANKFLVELGERPIEWRIGYG